MFECFVSQEVHCKPQVSLNPFLMIDSYTEPSQHVFRKEAYAIDIKCLF